MMETVVLSKNNILDQNIFLRSLQALGKQTHHNTGQKVTKYDLEYRKHVQTIPKYRPIAKMWLIFLTIKKIAKKNVRFRYLAQKYTVELLYSFLCNCKLIRSINEMQTFTE